MLVKSLVIYRASGTSVLASGSSTSWWSEQYRGGRSLPSHIGVVVVAIVCVCVYELKEY